MGDFLKRLLIATVFICTFLLFGCTNSNETAEKFARKGIYSVYLEETDISFTAVFDGEYQEYSFTSPSTLTGLKAVSYNGVDYELSYENIKQNTYSAALKCATDFSAATELLESSGTANGETILASIDGITAKGFLQSGKLSKLEFCDGKDKRTYKIKTEATG